MPLFKAKAPAKELAEALICNRNCGVAYLVKRCAKRVRNLYFVRWLMITPVRISPQTVRSFQCFFMNKGRRRNDLAGCGLDCSVTQVICVKGLWIRSFCECGKLRALASGNGFVLVWNSLKREDSSKESDLGWGAGSSFCGVRRMLVRCFWQTGAVARAGVSGGVIFT